MSRRRRWLRIPWQRIRRSTRWAGSWCDLRRRGPKSFEGRRSQAPFAATIAPRDGGGKSRAFEDDHRREDRMPRDDAAFSRTERLASSRERGADRARDARVSGIGGPREPRPSEHGLQAPGNVRGESVLAGQPGRPFPEVGRVQAVPRTTSRAMRRRLAAGVVRRRILPAAPERIGRGRALPEPPVDDEIASARSTLPSSFASAASEHGGSGPPRTSALTVQMASATSTFPSSFESPLRKASVAHSSGTPSRSQSRDTGSSVSFA